MFSDMGDSDSFRAGQYYKLIQAIGQPAIDALLKGEAAVVPLCDASDVKICNVTYGAYYGEGGDYYLDDIRLDQRDKGE